MTTRRKATGGKRGKIVGNSSTVNGIQDAFPQFAPSVVEPTNLNSSFIHHQQTQIIPPSQHQLQIQQPSFIGKPIQAVMPTKPSITHTSTSTSTSSTISNSTTIQNSFGSETPSASDIIAKYNLMCEVGEGTYGVVYKAELRAPHQGQPQPKRSKSVAVTTSMQQQQQQGVPIISQQQQHISQQQQHISQMPSGGRVAIKKFRQTKDGEGISLTACREIGLLKELDHDNIMRLVEVLLSPREKSLYLVLEYAEFDLFAIVKYHREKNIPTSESLVKSCMWQILNGINYLHSNWVIHRDIKPSNIMVTGLDSPTPGKVKIGDFGLARIFQSPLRALSDNGVVVTIWYRAPEVLFMSKHYTTAIDLWAIGCIFAELIIPRPLFQGKEKNQNDPTLFQDDQVEKIFRILGTPSIEQYPFMQLLPKWGDVQSWPIFPCVLQKIFASYNRSAYDLLVKLLHYDPSQRISASDALDHEYFKTPPFPSENVFGNSPPPYPLRQSLPPPNSQKRR